jgi:glycosyltransferase involved in cell wall biosynthesis
MIVKQAPDHLPVQGVSLEAAQNREIDRMRLSVCLCTYNGARYLQSQLDSIAAQERLPDELVVCDDRSTDVTPVLLEAFAARAPFPVRLYRNPQNIGSTRNFEKAIMLAEGDVIVTADQDDVWYPVKLARLESTLQSNINVGLVFSDADLIGSGGERLGRRLWPSVKFPPNRARAIARGKAFSVLLRRPAVTGAAMAFRAKYLKLILPIPPEWVHDEWIALLIAAVGPIMPLADPLMAYRLHSSNQIGVRAETFQERTRRSIDTPKSYFREVSERFGALHARLCRDLPGRLELLKLVEEKVDHFCVRARLPEGRLRRAPIVLRELLSLRYTRYSGTTLSFARDLAASSWST